MPRVNSSDVKAIIDTDLDPTPFITAANLVITDQLSSAGFSDAYLKEIERWYAAHLVCIADPRETRVDVDAKADFERPKVGTGLSGTSYGQQVLQLDTSGILAGLGRKKAYLRVSPRRENSC